MKRYLSILLFLTLLFSGCTIKRDVKPVDTSIIEKEICIIEDKRVRDGFLITYVDTLEEMGYKVKILPERSDKNMCKISSTYNAKWSWDLAIYMSYAKINIYNESVLVGSALYDSTQGGGRIFDKFGKGSTRIKDLVEELFGK